MHSKLVFYVETQIGIKPHNAICLEELHSLEALISFVFQLQLEGVTHPLPRVNFFIFLFRLVLNNENP